MRNELFNRAREKITTHELSPRRVIQICMKFAKEHDYDLGVLLTSKRLGVLDELKLRPEEVGGLAKQFKETAIDLSWKEALGVALSGEFFNRLGGGKQKHRIGVQIGEHHAKQKELLLSDGFISRVGSGIIPFQEVVAQNIVGKDKGKKIKDVLKRTVSEKIAKRNTYNLNHGLIINVFQPSFSGAIGLSGQLLVREMVDWGYANKYYPTFLIIYRNDLSICDIYLLNRMTDNLAIGSHNHSGIKLRDL